MGEARLDPSDRFWGFSVLLPLFFPNGTVPGAGGGKGLSVVRYHMRNL